MKQINALRLLMLLLCPIWIYGGNPLSQKITRVLKKTIIAKADSALTQEPITVTAEQCPRSAGGIHDFYSEGDYWWQNPADTEGCINTPYKHLSPLPPSLDGE